MSRKFLLFSFWVASLRFIEDFNVCIKSDFDDIMYGIKPKLIDLIVKPVLCVKKLQVYV